MGGRSLTLAVGFLLVAAAVLLYLEWWRAGELELLHGRVSDVEGKVVSLTDRARKPAGRRTPTTERTTD